jgi:glycosyltransferase involved in cell wall biosynthesis
LDVFICTSTEEGIPAPPLEALACGVPVVIPVGVGMLDLLPDEPGIYRYEAGNQKELATAVKSALAGKHERPTLRDYVAPYTVSAWAESHQAVIDKLLHV